MKNVTDFNVVDSVRRDIKVLVTKTRYMVCMCVYMYVCIYVCMCVYTYVCVYVCMCVLYMHV